MIPSLVDDLERVELRPVFVSAYFVARAIGFLTVGQGALISGADGVVLFVVALAHLLARFKCQRAAGAWRELDRQWFQLITELRADRRAQEKRAQRESRE